MKHFRLVLLLNALAIAAPFSVFAAPASNLSREGVRRLEQAAEQGNAKAAEWWRKAAEQGFDPAEEAWKELEN